MRERILKQASASHWHDKQFTPWHAIWRASEGRTRDVQYIHVRVDENSKTKLITAGNKVKFQLKFNFENGFCYLFACTLPTYI